MAWHRRLDDKETYGHESSNGSNIRTNLFKEILYRKNTRQSITFSEGSISKNLPIDMLHDFKIHFKGLFRIRYRGKTDYRKRYFRDPRHCLQKYATSFAIYPISEESYKVIIGGLK